MVARTVATMLVIRALLLTAISATTTLQPLAARLLPLGAKAQRPLSAQALPALLLCRRPRNTQDCMSRDV